MTSGSCLVIEATETRSTLKTINITARLEEARCVAEAVAIESALIRSLALFQFSSTIRIVHDGRVDEAVRAGLVVLADEFGKRLDLEDSLEPKPACDATKVVVGGNERIEQVSSGGSGSCGCAHCRKQQIMDGMGRSCDVRVSTSNARYGRRKQPARTGRRRRGRWCKCGGYPMMGS